MASDQSAVEKVRGWILAVGILVFRAVEWAILGPYRVLKTYAGIGKRRSGDDSAEGESGDPPGE